MGLSYKVPICGILFLVARLLPFSMFLMFQDLLDTKGTGKKCTAITFLGERLWEKEPEEMSHEGQMGMAHAAKESGHVGPTCWYLGPHFDLPF
jgi:hypothetical protein